MIPNHYDHDKRTSMKGFGLELSTLISELDEGGDHIHYQSQVSKGFYDIAGPTVSAHTRAVHFADGKVIVVVDSGIWAQELAFLAEEYREKLNEFLGGDIVTAVTFRTRPMR